MKACCFIILYLFPQLQAAIFKQNMSSEPYQWKTGSWGACDRRTKCGEGHKIRRVWCINSSGYIVPISNCNSSTRPSTTKQCFSVCDHHKYVLRWRIGEWSPCIAKTIKPCSGESMVGVADRTVECVLSSPHLVVDSEACEYFWNKPDSEMSCSIDCPQDCVTATKNASCHVKECSELISWTVEVSDLIAAPNSESGACSGFSTTSVCKKNHLVEKCKNLDNERSEYRLKIGSWGACTSEFISNDGTVKELQVVLHPVTGISQRNITCLDVEGHQVDISLCNFSDIRPSTVRQCVVPVDCVVSPWSEWHVLEEGCVASDGTVHPETRVRERKLLQLPVGSESKPCPLLYEERIINTGLPSCSKYKWYPLEWTDCQIIFHGIHGEEQVIKPTCGNGLQYRNLTCLRMKDTVPVDEKLCKDPQPPTVQRCKVPCKRDCEVTHWGKWGPCMPYNNTDLIELLDKSGYRRRVRSVFVNPSNGGKYCPHLEELDICLRVDIFNWHYGKWSECTIMDPHASCGRGRTTRDYTCVNHNGVPIIEYWCDHHYPLEMTEDFCRVPCPNDCIMSEWSDWSLCSRSCFEGKKHGSFFRNRTILAIAGEGGKPCRKKRRENDWCNPYRCNTYKWKTSDWGECSAGNGNDIISEPCGVGTQKRDVLCTNGTETVKSTNLCMYLKKPEAERKCYLPCPVDCVISNFTDWTSCNGSCSSDVIQYRHRIVLQSPKFKGKPCPEALVEARPCSTYTDHHCMLSLSQVWKNMTYQWDAGPWSDCQLPLENQSCGMGFQIRNVTCFDAENKAVEPHLCLPSNWTLPDEPIQDVPSGLRSCEVVCSSDCVVSAWSSWTKCDYSYHSRRFRSRELVGTGISIEECLLKISLLEEDACPMIPSDLVEPSDDLWLSCIVEGENQTFVTTNGQRMLRDCGSGYRYKAGIRLNTEMGVEPGSELDFCLIDCPLDCQMSSWSEWTECNVPCGQGFRERQRNVLVQNNELGRPCPKTVNKTEIQRDVCNIVCMDYHWVAGGWSDCQLDDPDSECGDGIHFRTVRCYDKRTDQKTHKSRCDPLLRPLTVESCRIYCPGECVVSPWSISKKCTEPCSANKFQEQRRTIYRLPNSTAEPCPPLVATEPCVLNSTCHHHYWVLGPWGSCVLPERAYCGEGLLKRPLICLRSDGRQVDPIQCEKTQKSLSLQEPLSKPCYIDCPVDCVMSQWSPWNKTSCSTCNTTGVMTRTRSILETPSDAGQPCPAELVQKMPCEFKPCYHWKKTEWSQCDLEGASCGYGIRRRVVECIRFDRLKVDIIHCLVVNVTFSVNSWLDPAWLAAAQEDSREEELCHVPCPGDCIVSEWSAWNHCHKNCRIGQKVGYQTSSRHVLFDGLPHAEPCPKQLWRRKPCWSDNCDMFAWKLRNDSYICERKDGLIVEGGCASEPLPCFKGCENLGGICESATGVCYCLDEKDEKTILGPTSRRCRTLGKGPRPPANHSAPTPEIKLMYYPDDSQVSFWMYAMISIGTAFVIFVAVTVYLMCRSSLRQRTVSVERQASVRRRVNGLVIDHPVMESSPVVRSHCQRDS